MKKVIVVTGASSGFGALASRALASRLSPLTPTSAGSRKRSLRSSRPHLARGLFGFTSILRRMAARSSTALPIGYEQSCSEISVFRIF